MVTRSLSFDGIVIGGGFYGCRLASFLAERVGSVAILERNDAILTRASYVNQARVHGGYHYPRSILTSVRSRRNYSRFVTEYSAAIVGNFTKLYAIARMQSKTSAGEFEQFCRRIGAPIARAPTRLAQQFDPASVEGVFVVDECAFDAVKLASCVAGELAAAGVSSLTATEALAVRPGQGRRLIVDFRQANGVGVVEADWVLLATYSALNEVLLRSGLSAIPLIHELTEVVITDPPPALAGLGVTVMDGPFWSSMPFPALSAYSLTHVRYTPHARWTTPAGHDAISGGDVLRLNRRNSNGEAMQRDAARYLPGLRFARPRASLWEVKTILPRSDVDDSRPILARAIDGAPGLVAVLGAKIDSVYDVEAALASTFNGIPR